MLLSYFANCSGSTRSWTLSCAWIDASVLNTGLFCWTVVVNEALGSLTSDIGIAKCSTWTVTCAGMIGSTAFGIGSTRIGHQTRVDTFVIMANLVRSTIVVNNTFNYIVNNMVKHWKLAWNYFQILTSFTSNFWLPWISFGTVTKWLMLDNHTNSIWTTVAWVNTATIVASFILIAIGAGFTANQNRLSYLDISVLEIAIINLSTLSIATTAFMTDYQSLFIIQ